MRVWVGLVALMMLLAGCTGADDEPGDSTTTGTGTSTDTQTQTGTQTGTQTTTGTTTQTGTQTGTKGPDPRPPVASLQISEVTGTAPLQVNITVDAEDPDGDLSAWSLDLGDGTVEEGQEFPTALNHTYMADGNYTLNLTVTDAEGLTDSMAVLIEVSGGALTAYEVTVTVDVPCRGCSANTQACIDLTTGEEILHDCKFIPVPPETWGLPFVVESTGGDPDARWRTDGDCPGTGSDYLTNDGAESGTVPTDVTCILVWEFTTATPSDITFRTG